MKKYLILLCLIFFSAYTANSATFEGGVSEEGRFNSNRIIDRNTGLGVGGARVTLPKQRYSTNTDQYRAYPSR